MKTKKTYGEYSRTILSLSLKFLNLFQDKFGITLYMTTLIVVLISFPIHNVIAQNSEIKRTNQWCFSIDLGIDFNGMTPVLTTSNVSFNAQQEGGACISDTAGKLLFYQGGLNYGVTLMNRNHTAMPNGGGLLTNASSSQSGIILPQPCSDSLYYFFTVNGATGGSGEFSYSIVDMSLDGGLGDVIPSAKNVFLFNNGGDEKVTAARHCNGIDIWVITHDINDAFYAYLLTNAGVSAPVISNVGLSHPDWRGYMKASPDGKHIASADYYLTGSDLCDFDNATGIVSNPIPLSGGPSAEYGVSFSPNSKVLYIGHVAGGIDQYDLTAANIPASKIGIGGSIITAIQQASDGRIYVSRADFNGLPNDYLGVINNPNVVGTGCNYVENGFYLGGMESSDALPNFFEAYFDTTSGANMIANAGPDVTICSGAAATLNASGGGNYCGGNYLWSNGQTSASIVVSSTITTTYTVTVTNSCRSSSDTVTVFVASSPSAVISSNITICAGTSATLTASGGTFYSWSGGQSTSSITPVPTATATYSVIVSNGSCADTTGVTVTVTPAVIATAGQSSTICAGQSLTLIASGGTNYSWSNGDSTSAITVSPPSTSTYSVIVSMDSCSDTAITTVTVNVCDTVIIDTVDCSNTGELYIPNAFSPNGDGENDVLKIYYGNYACIKTVELVIYNRWGEEVFKTTSISDAWDGKYEGETIHTEVLVYYLNATMIDGKEIIRKGNISLVK